MYNILFLTCLRRDFLGGPLVKTMLPRQGVWVRFLVGELRSKMPCLWHGMAWHGICLVPQKKFFLIFLINKMLDTFQ